MSSAGPGPGTVIDDWMLEERLGEGGFGEVWRARSLPDAPEGTPARVAIKVSRDQARVADLAREAAILQRLDHEGIVRIHRVDATARPPFIAMELIEGGDLGALLAARAANAERFTTKKGCLAFYDAARITRLAAEALAAAHAEGIVHGDLKPANVLVDGGGLPDLTRAWELRVVLADFGLGRTAAGGGASLAGSLDGLSIDAADSIRGTLAYLAPEVKRGGRATPASDVYAIGLLLHEMLLGQLPRGAWRSPSRQGIECPEDLDRLLRHLLDPEPRRRPSTEELVGELWSLHAAWSAEGWAEKREEEIASKPRICPVDGALLVHQVVHGVELDRCRDCGGTWFDRSELETVIRQLVGDAARESGREVDEEGVEVSVRTGERDPDLPCVVCEGPLRHARIRFGAAGGPPNDMQGEAYRCVGHGQWIPSETRLELVGRAHDLGRATDEVLPARRPEPVVEPPAPRKRRASRRRRREGERPRRRLFVDREGPPKSPTPSSPSLNWVVIVIVALVFVSPCCGPMGRALFERDQKRAPTIRSQRRALAAEVITIVELRTDRPSPHLDDIDLAIWRAQFRAQDLRQQEQRNQDLVRNAVRDHVLAIEPDIDRAELDRTLDEVFQ